MPLYLDDGCGGIIRFIRWSNTARPLRCTKRCVLPPLDAAIFNFNKAYSTLCHRECCDASCQCANISESGDSGDTRGMEQQKIPIPRSRSYPTSRMVIPKSLKLDVYVSL